MKTEIIYTMITVKLDEGNFLVDISTGTSMALDTDQITINGEKYKVYNVPPREKRIPLVDGPEEAIYLDLIIKNTKDAIEKDIIGIIGNDILSQTGLTIDYKQETIEFFTTTLKKSISINEREYNYFRDYILFTDEFSFNDIPIKNVALDVNSIINYVPDSHFKDIKKALRPYNLGRKEFPIYAMNVSFAGEQIKTPIHLKTSSSFHPRFNSFKHIYYETPEIPFVCLAQVFKDRKVSIDYNNNVLYFE